MDNPADRANFVTCIVFGTIGLLFNIFLIRVILGPKELRQAEYMAFILHRAAVDSLFCLQAIFLQPVGILYWSTDHTYCIVAGAVSNSLIITMVLSEPLLALNRFISVCHREYYQRIYRKRYITLMCVAVWMAGLLATCPFLVTGTLGKTPGYACGVTFTPETFVLSLVSMYPGFAFSYVCLLVFYVKILSHLKRHQDQAQNTPGQHSRLSDDKALLIAIAAEAVLPFLASAPATVTVTIRMYAPDLVPDMLLYAIMFVHTVCTSLMSPIMSLTIVRPIRKEALGVLKRWCGWGVTSVVPAQ